MAINEGTHFGQKAGFFLQRTALGGSDSMSTQLLKTIAVTDIQQLDLV